MIEDKILSIISEFVRNGGKLSVEFKPNTQHIGLNKTKISNGGIRAFSDSSYDYYKLKKDIGDLKAGAVFVHDPDDALYGSIADGCLKLCWTPSGDCYGFGGNTFILHSDLKTNKEWFEKVTY